MKRYVGALAVGCLVASLAPRAADAFCGFYVSKADTKLFNKASQVVLVRDDDRTVITMVNDFKGDPREFAVVIPVPTFIEREQIHVTHQAVVQHLDAYTAPRLVEYFDPDPCQVRRRLPMVALGTARDQVANMQEERESALGISVEARYTVGEYDIVILSAKQSDGLETWLRENGYRIPKGASGVLDSYIKQGTRFFVARVNLDEQSALGFTYLRPLQIAFESPKFMLPIRLGTVNADGPQELFVYTLTRTGRVETTNYRTVKLPTDVELPEFIEDDFSNFYRDMFAKQVKKENERAVFLEYAWDMGWCDPCAADPLSVAELRELGAFWVQERSGPKSAARDVFVTRLHVRYDAQHFPEDLAFQETGDRTNFQGRYVLRRAWTGDADCSGARKYRKELRERQIREAEKLASLTGWKLDDILARIDLADAGDITPWWKKIWDEDR